MKLLTILLGFGVVALAIASTVSAGANKPSFALQFIPLVLVLGLYISPLVFLWKYAGGIRRLQDGGGWTAR